MHDSDGRSRLAPRSRPLLRIAAVLLSLGGAGGAPVAEAGLLDIIVAVDGSGDMGEEIADFTVNFPAYISTLSAAGAEPRLILIGTGICLPVPIGSGACPADENLPEYRHVAVAVGSTNALSLILSTYPQWESSLRPGASRLLMVISSDDSALSAASFEAQLLALDPSFAGYEFHAYVAHSLCPVSGGAAVGDVYLDLVGGTGGVSGDLCGQSISPFLIESSTEGIALASVFRRGDANRDGGYDIADAIATLGFLFSGGSIPCALAADSNDDESVDIGDAIYTLAALFSGGTAPPPPTLGCAQDPTPGGLDCTGAVGCS